jgi:hypothetical protein
MVVCRKDPGILVLETFWFWIKNTSRTDPGKVYCHCPESRTKITILKIKIVMNPGQNYRSAFFLVLNPGQLF